MSDLPPTRGRRDTAFLQRPLRRGGPRPLVREQYRVSAADVPATEAAACESLDRTEGLG